MRALAGALPVLVLLVLAVPLHGAQAGDLPAIEKAWSRPTTVKVGVVYMHIKGTSRDLKLTGASTPVAAKVEVHETRMKNGMMDMREVGSVAIPKGETVEFRTGGLHLMLMGLKTSLSEGMRFPLTLKFGDAGERTIEVDVRRRPPR